MGGSAAWRGRSRTLALGFVLTVLCGSCGAPEGGLHVIVEGTLRSGIDFDRLVVRVHRAGEERLLREEVFEGRELSPLPVTLNLLSGPRTPAGTKVVVAALAERSGQLVRSVSGEAALVGREGQILRLDLGAPDANEPVDAGPDAGTDTSYDGGADAGEGDAGAPDGGPDPDAGVEDAGSQIDGGTPDAGVPLDAGVVIPLHIEAEDYLAGGQGIGYFDTTPGNTGGGCRNEDVDMKANTPEADGGCTVGWFEKGEWLAYDINVVQGGAYDLRARVSRGTGGSSSFHIFMDGVDVSGPVVVSNTGNWDKFTTITTQDVQLSPGRQTLTLVNDGGVFDLNWIRFEFQAQ